MVVRQLPAATARSVPVSSTCMSFSASAKVEGETSGPTAGAAPKAGGAPGGSSAGFCALPGPAAGKPHLGGIDIRFMNAALLGNGDYLELRLRLLGGSNACAELDGEGNRDQRQEAEETVSGTRSEERRVGK